MERKYLSFEEAEESANNAWMWLFHYFSHRMLDHPDFAPPDDILDDEEALSEHHESNHAYLSEAMDATLQGILEGRTDWTISAEDLPMFSRAMKQYKAATDWMELNDPTRHQRRREAQSRKAAAAAK